MRGSCFIQQILLAIIFLSRYDEALAFVLQRTTACGHQIICLKNALTGADIEQPAPTSKEKTTTTTATTGGDNNNNSAAPDDDDDIPYRGKVNEIDFCIAPADVSLSRSYGMATNTKSSSSSPASLTRALNNASNRAVRRILLARSWPSAEALNMSLRQVLAAAEKQQQQKEAEAAAASSSDQSSAKCPVPRPILNILVGRSGADSESSPSGVVVAPVPRSRTDEEYVADQLRTFRQNYGALAGYSVAEAYLESILSLATSGEESSRISEVMESGVYDDAYRRVLAVLKSVGAVFEEIPGTSRTKIASKLIDQDICLSMIDKISLKRSTQTTDLAINNEEQQEEEEEKAVVMPAPEESRESPVVESEEAESKKRLRLKFWGRRKKLTEVEAVQEQADEKQDDEEDEEMDKEDSVKISGDDLGGVLLSAKEPSMTRQLNVLSNIVQRALLFGGDQELLVLSETLEADLPAFIDRWYPNTGGVQDRDEETRPGVQYFNCLVQLLESCYRDGVVTDLNPPLPMIQSYSNAFERLTASLVELGSGYIKPIPSDMISTMPKPRTAQEELGRFAVWESNFRKTSSSAGADVSSYPEDLEGTWEVRDQVGGETIGVSTVVFDSQGSVSVAPPMKGLRWRLDPGPTHLDTCTFQVLGDDGAILQYRGFIDRGARLEARFSKRSITIRGSVMFQMRDGDAALMGDDYWKDMLPINYRTGTTKFVMSKKVDNEEPASSFKQPWSP